MLRPYPNQTGPHLKPDPALTHDFLYGRSMLRPYVTFLRALLRRPLLRPPLLAQLRHR